jgi:hypothetical protein
MSVAVGLLDFYILEASEYVDQLDALVGACRADAPRVDAVHHGGAGAARELDDGQAAPDGRVGRFRRARRARPRDGSVRWNVELRSAIVSAIDDIRILLRTVRTWGAAEEQRAAGRIAELRRFVPDGAAPANTPISRRREPDVLRVGSRRRRGRARQLRSAPTDRRSLDEALGRVRALRGISALKDLPPLADVADAIEHAASTSTGEGRSLTPQHTELYDAAAHVLRRAARELRTSGRPDASAPEVRRFADAAAALHGQTRDEEQVVPVANLFFSDAGPHVVSRSDRPPTNVETRFRTEITSLAEHLRRLVADTAPRRAPSVAIAPRTSCAAHCAAFVGRSRASATRSWPLLRERSRGA